MDEVRRQKRRQKKRQQQPALVNWRKVFGERAHWDVRDYLALYQQEVAKARASKNSRRQEQLRSAWQALRRNIAVVPTAPGVPLPPIDLEYLGRAILQDSKKHPTGSPVLQKKIAAYKRFLKKRVAIWFAALDADVLLTQRKPLSRVLQSEIITRLPESVKTFDNNEILKFKFGYYLSQAASGVCTLLFPAQVSLGKFLVRYAASYTAGAKGKEAFDKGIQTAAAALAKLNLGGKVAASGDILHNVALRMIKMFPRAAGCVSEQLVERIALEASVKSVEETLADVGLPIQILPQGVDHSQWLPMLQSPRAEAHVKTLLDVIRGQPVESKRLLDLLYAAIDTADVRNLQVVTAKLGEKVKNAGRVRAEARRAERRKRAVGARQKRRLSAQRKTRAPTKPADYFGVKLVKALYQDVTAPARRRSSSKKKRSLAGASSSPAAVPKKTQKTVRRGKSPSPRRKSSTPSLIKAMNAKWFG